MATTQQEHPVRAALRTFLQVWLPGLAAALVVIPEVVQIIVEATGDAMPANLRLVLAGIVTACAVVSAILARIVAVRAGDRLLERVLSLGSAPEAAAVTADGVHVITDLTPDERRLIEDLRATEDR